jgi:PadR family transcriptional regulator PadR
MRHHSCVHTARPEDDKWMAQTRRGSLELCVLAILARGRRYGYDLVQALTHLEGLVLKEGTIYPLLNRLQGEGLVNSEWQPSPDGPARRYYTLTPVGEERLRAMKAQWKRFTAEVDQILEEDA